MGVKIIDYGMGNLLSVKRAFEKCGANAEIIDNPEMLNNADHIVLPGVGAFKDGMANLRAGNWEEYIKEAVYQRGVPLLGICLGMQLLADIGYEVEKTPGLGLIHGEIIKLEGRESERIPHVGWNEINVLRKDLLLEGIPDKTDFYFVHSYHFDTSDKSTIIAETPYSGNFTSIVGKDLVYGVQFHPEKSQRPGFKLIQNFLKL